MIDCSRCIRQKMKGSSSSQSQVRRNVYHNFRQYKYRHHNYTHCYSCSQSQSRRYINLQLKHHQMHKQTGGCLLNLQTLFDFLRCKTFSLKIWLCKTFDKYHVWTRVVESESPEVGKIGSDFLSDFLAKMPKCHKMPKCLHFGSGSCIRIS